ncbi:MAG TPA: YerC/YecD family TrpR-related protein [Candidatus Limnocylindria bacterium]
MDEGVSYHEISERTGASSATISRVGQWLRYGRDGYRLVIDRTRRRRDIGRRGEGR